MPRLRFNYTLSDVAAPQMRVSDRWSFAGGGGELWYPQRSFSERQVARIKIDVPNGYGAIATGKLLRRTDHPFRRRFTYVARNPSKLAFAYGPYHEAVVGGAVTTRVLTMQRPEEATRLVRALAQVIEVLSRSFGQTLHDSFSIVEIDFNSRVLGTSEYDMIFASPSKMAGEFDIAYWAHEFGHQWWGNSVRAVSGSPGASLLTEGLAQYGALLSMEAIRGRAAAAEYRRNGLPTNPRHSLQAYRALVAAGQDKAPADFLPAGQEQILQAHSLATSKGALTLRYLAALAGTDRLNALLRSFFATKAQRRTSWAELEAWIDAGTQGEYRWLLQWLHRTGGPALRVGYCLTGSRVTGEIRQSGTPFRLTLPMELAGPWGTRRFMAAADGENSRFTFDAPGPVARFAADPDAVVPSLSLEATPEPGSCAADRVAAWRQN